MDFQLPPGVGPRQYNIPQSIDELFNAYQQQRVQNQNIAVQQAGLAQQQRTNNQQDVQQVASQGFADSQVTPQELAQAQQPPRMQEATVAGQYNSGPQGQNIAQQPAQENPHVSAIRNFLAFQKTQREIAQSQQAAGLASTQAGTKKTTAEANAAELENSLLKGDGNGGNMITGLAGMVRNKKITLDEANSIIGRNQTAHLALANEIQKGQPNINALNNQQTKDKATAAYEGGADVQGKVRTSASVIADANVLKDISSKLATTDYQLINKYGLAIAAQKGSVQAQDLIDQSKLVADRFQGIIGGGSDAKLELGLSLFHEAKTKAQIERSVKRITDSLNTYSSSLQGKGTGQALKAETNTPKKIGRFTVAEE